MVAGMEFMPAITVSWCPAQEAFPVLRPRDVEPRDTATISALPIATTSTPHIEDEVP